MKSIKESINRREAERLDFPDCWEEVAPEEWRRLLWLRQQLMERKGITLDDILRDWCAFVLQNRGLKKNRPEFWLLVRRLAGTLGWMWRTEQEGEHTWVSLTYDSTVNLLPKVGPLLGPASHGADLTFGEFRAATAAMNLYDRSHEDNDLLALCAVLYRPAQKLKGVFRREPFDADRLPVLMARAAMIQPYLRWGIYAWFAYFCQYLYTGTFLIDGQEVCFAPVFDRTKRTATLFNHRKKLSVRGLKAHGELPGQYSIYPIVPNHSLISPAGVTCVPFSKRMPSTGATCAPRSALRRSLGVCPISPPCVAKGYTFLPFHATPAINFFTAGA